MQTDLFKTLVSIATFILAQTGGGGAALPPASGAPGARAVVGYYSEYYPGERAPYESLRDHSDTLTAIASFSYYLNGQGYVSGERPTAAADLAQQKGVKVLALVHNFTRKNGFESGTAHQLLANPLNRSRAVANLLSLVTKRGYSGINLDLECVPASDRGNLTAFVRELSQAMRPLGFLMTASVPAKTADHRDNNWSGAFDYAALGVWLDQIMLMTYDENGAPGQAGPVASISWVEQVIRYASSVIHSRKIVLGLAGYGYDWVQGKTGGTAREFHDIQALADRMGVAPKWDNVAKVPYFRYYSASRTRIVWYENNWSASYKLDLVNRYNLGGVAVWRLGGEDPQLWRVIRAKLG